MVSIPSHQLIESARQAHREQRYAEAEALCRELLNRMPADAEAGYLLGLVLHQMGREAEAAQWLNKAAELDPRSPNACYALGCVHTATGDAAQAAKAFAAALRRDPKSINACYGLGNAWCKLGEFERAVSVYRRGIELNPQDHELWNNLGQALEALFRTEEAQAAYQRAIRIQPEFALARSNHALSLLSLGRLQEGLGEYEWRWRKTPFRPYPQPFWRGQPIPGKTLLVCAEQGFGDVIQFVRFVRQTRALAGRVILECQPPLKRLFEHSRCADEVIELGEIPPPFDYYVPVMSLPLVLGTTMDTIPTEPWLTAPPVEALPAIPAGFLKVGLVWACSPTHINYNHRSVPFSELGPILAQPGVVFYCLQVPIQPEDEPRILATPRLVSLTGFLKDFYDTAGFLGQMDLVLSVDTAVTHVAGALGKPTWVLLAHPGDWRWLQKRADSPWYPSVRLFRQSHSGRWQSAVAQVAEELGRWAADSGRQTLQTLQ